MIIQEAAQRLGKSEPTIRRLIKQGKLSATLVNGKYDISEGVINDYLRDQSTDQSTNQLDQVRLINDQAVISLKEEAEHLREQLAKAQEEVLETRQRADQTDQQLISLKQETDHLRDQVDQFNKAYAEASGIRQSLEADKRYLQGALEEKDRQIAEKDQQISQLHSLIAMEKQEKQLLLEAPKKKWWHRLVYKQKNREREQE